MQPRRWTPPPATGRVHRTSSIPPLPPVRRIELPAAGPEDVVLAPDGTLIVGTDDGAILKVDPATDTVTPLANTGGRPLGLHADPDGRVLICDFERGLLELTPDGELTVLVDEIDGERLLFASNVVRDADGTIYFSSSSARWSLADYKGDLLEHSCTGRLFRRTTEGSVETLADGLKFANGVVLAPDRSCVLVAETAGYRVSRHWLSGPLAGTTDLLVENLPGFPDNMGLGSDGLVWITLPSPRDPLLDRLLPRPGLFRKLIWSLPERVHPRPKRTVWVQAVDFDGTLVHDLQTEGTDYSMVTGVVELDGTLYLGSLGESAVAVSHLPSSRPA